MYMYFSGATNTRSGIQQSPSDGNGKKGASPARPRAAFLTPHHQLGAPNTPSAPNTPNIPRGHVTSRDGGRALGLVCRFKTRLDRSNG